MMANFTDRMKIGQKLTGGFLIVAAIAAGIGLAGWWGMNGIMAVADDLGMVRLPSVQALLEIDAAQAEMFSTEYAMLNPAMGDAARQHQRERCAAAQKRFEEAWALFEPLSQTPEVAATWKEFVPAWKKWLADHEEFHRLNALPKTPATWQQLNVHNAQVEAKSFLEAEALLAKLVEINIAAAKAANESADVAENRADTILLVAVVLGVAFAIGMGVMLTRSITTPMSQGVEMMKRIARGDLAMRLKMERQDEIGELAEAMDSTSDVLQRLINDDGGATLKRAAEKDMTARVKHEYEGVFEEMKKSINLVMESLDQSLGQVSMAAEQVAAASEQIGSGSQSLAQGTSEQASALEEVSSSLQEMAAMTRQNAGNAKEAKSMADAAKAGADKGVENMKRMSAAIESIKKSSDDTAKIIKTIDEIAFQTNLLALNAAVEAARAGEAGMGFAVVADEVRKLAMRSAEAAKNTANMIEESVKNSNNGVALNGEVMKSFEEINGMARKVSEVIAEISAASDQQTLGIDQVNKAIEQMNQVTQQNAANSEESASSAEEMSSQAQELQALVGSFEISGSGMTAPAARRTATRTTTTPAAKPVAKTAVRPSAFAAAGGVDPRKAIPFDDDAALKEF